MTSSVSYSCETADDVGPAAGGWEGDRPAAAVTEPARVLAEVVRTVPYCSASSYYEYFGDAPAHPRFGASCAWQSFEVGRRLGSTPGGTVRYHVDGRHVAAVVHGPDGLEVLDPYLMHLEPVRLRLADIRPDGSVVTSVPALPRRTDADGITRPGRVRAVWLPQRGRLRLEYGRFSPSRGHHFVSRFFDLATDQELRVVPPPADVVRPLLLHPEQNNVSIRVVDPIDDQVRELLYPLPPSGAVARVRADRLHTRDNQGALSPAGTPGYRRTLRGIAGALHIDVAELVDFVLGGAEIYRRVAPADLPRPAYRLVDE